MLAVGAKFVLSATGGRKLARRFKQNLDICAAEAQFRGLLDITILSFDDQPVHFVPENGITFRRLL